MGFGVSVLGRPGAAGRERSSAVTLLISGALRQICLFFWVWVVVSGVHDCRGRCCSAAMFGRGGMSLKSSGLGGVCGVDKAVTHCERNAGVCAFG